MLRLFHTFIEVSDYVQRKDKASTIERLARFVRNGLKNVDNRGING